MGLPATPVAFTASGKAPTTLPTRSSRLSAPAARINAHSGCSSGRISGRQQQQLPLQLRSPLLPTPPNPSRQFTTAAAAAGANTAAAAAAQQQQQQELRGKDVVMRFYEAYNVRDIDTIASLIA